jgi:Pyridoxamine 5'-phosphate oxidase
MVLTMATWAEFEADAPALAVAVRERFDAHKHKTIATLRRDGSPRISGIECEIEDGELRFGSMLSGVKALDLLRDPRLALHSGSDEPPTWNGDAKIAGRAIAIPRDGMHLFRCAIHEVVLVGLNDERKKLVIESWHEGRGTSHIER